jgi:hypothetical protein
MLALLSLRPAAPRLLDLTTTSCLAIMSELMGDIRAKPKPGTALRTMMKEHRHLDEFMTMVMAKWVVGHHLLRSETHEGLGWSWMKNSN